MARKKKHEEHENHERWLVSYADFITLLFAFFVVMYSMSSVNEGKYRVLAESLETVFSTPTRSSNPIQVGQPSKGKGEKSPSPGKPQLPESDIELPAIPHNKLPLPPPMAEATKPAAPEATETMPSAAEISPAAAEPANKPSTPADKNTLESINELSQQLSVALTSLIQDKNVIITKGDDRLELEIKSKVLFHSGDSRLERNAVPVIGKIANILNASANPIQVEGFTDNNPISTPRFPSNWELSAARAASVVHLLDRYGIEPERMSAIGYGEYKPIADNSSEQGRQKNRRVVLVVVGSKGSSQSLNILNPQANQPVTAVTDTPPTTSATTPPMTLPANEVTTP